MRKISLTELKKALQWIEANTNALNIIIDFSGDSITIKTVDRYEQAVAIELYDTDRSQMMPKITKTERL